MEDQEQSGDAQQAIISYGDVGNAAATASSEVPSLHHVFTPPIAPSLTPRSYRLTELASICSAACTSMARGMSLPRTPAPATFPISTRSPRPSAPNPNLLLAIDIRFEAGRLDDWRDDIESYDTQVLGVDTEGRSMEFDQQYGRVAGTLLNLAQQLQALLTGSLEDGDSESLRSIIDFRESLRQAPQIESSVARFVIPILESGLIFNEAAQGVDYVCELIDCICSFKSGLLMRYGELQSQIDSQSPSSVSADVSQNLQGDAPQSTSTQFHGAPPQYAIERKGKFKAQKVPNSSVTFLGPPPPYSFKEEPLRLEMDIQEEHKTVKAVIVGDGACGKTCAMIAHIARTYPEVYVPTVFDNYLFNGITHDKASSSYFTQLHIWDTAGQEDYDRLRPLSYPDADVIVISFAIDSPDSLDNVQEKWISEVLHFNRGVPIVLAGLKSDLRNDPRTIEELNKTSQKPVQYHQAEEVAKKIGATAYMECSAKDASGLQDVFKVTTEVGISKKYKESRVDKRQRRGLFT